jgi:hypothetical protein
MFFYPISQAIGEDPPPHIHVSVEEVTDTDLLMEK